MQQLEGAGLGKQHVGGAWSWPLLTTTPCMCDILVKLHHVSPSCNAKSLPCAQSNCIWQSGASGSGSKGKPCLLKCRLRDVQVQSYRKYSWLCPHWSCSLCEGGIFPFSASALLCSNLSSFSVWAEQEWKNSWYKLFPSILQGQQKKKDRIW